MKDKKGTWYQAILSFIIPVLLVLGIRWALIEPFVIPSGSMLPNLMVHDHIIVNKTSFGLKIPFTNHWVVKWATPKRGDVLVFRYPLNPDVFYIKRLIGLPGDNLKIKDGVITVNDQPLSMVALSGESREPGYLYFREKNDGAEYDIRFLSLLDDVYKEYTIPAGEYFFMGDNRDESSDSREWGFVKEDYLVGKAVLIWLSCESMLPTMKYMCDPSQIRSERLLKFIE